MTTHGLPGPSVTHLRSTKGDDLTRLSWRGWHVDLGGQRVTVPSQPIAGKNTADLDLLLGTGYRVLGIATAPRNGPLPYVRDRLPDNTITHIVETLQSAQRIANAACRRGAFDVYDCTSQAWQDAGMAVPYAWLMRSLRAALPPGAGNLAVYDRRASAAAVHDLYATAIRSWRRQDGSTPAASMHIA